MKRKLPAAIAALLLCIALCSCARRKTEVTVTDTLNIWCTADSPVTAALGKLTAEYNSLPGQTMPVSLKVFPSEAALAEAFNSLRPDLLLCTHDRASHLCDAGQLSIIPGLGEELYDKMNDSFNVFFDGSFIPMGGEVPLLLCAPGITAAPGTLSELSQIVRDEDGHIMAVSSWADLFAAASCQLDFNLFCELKKDSDSEAFAELYNLFAELAYTGKLSFSAHPAELVAAGELKYALLSSCALSELELEGCTVSTMPDMYDEPSQFMSSVWGFAVTAGPGSSAKSASAFFKWLLEGSRLGDAALGCGLMPAAVCTVRNTPMSAALFDIYRGCRLYMAPDGSPYYTARAEFDSEVSSAMARLY